MKKAIVLSVRTGQDKDTGEDLVWVTLGKLPTKNREKGTIYAPIKSETVICVSANKSRTTAKYNTYITFNVGDLVELYLAVNEVSEKTYVDNVVLVKSSPYTEAEIYGE